MAQGWDIDPKTGDYKMTGGAPIQTDSLKIPAYYRLKIKRAGWLYAPADDYGSDFHTVKKRRTSDDASLIEAIAARALQPMVDDGRASTITIATTVVARNAVGLETEIFDARGRIETLTLPQV